MMRNFTTKSRAASNKALIDDAEKIISDVDQDVEREITALEGTKDSRLIPLLDKLRDQTRVYANRNALVVAARFRQSSKSIIALALVVLTIGLLFAGLTVSYIDHNNGETAKLHKTAITTRFASAYNACLNTDARSLAAKGILIKLFNPTHPVKTQPEIRKLILTYNQAVVPLRSNQGNVFTEPLPNPIPVSWKKACAEYAHKSITDVIPPYAAPPSALAPKP